MRRLGSIECLEVQDPEGNSPLWIIMFHGFGADANDLLSLHKVITPQRQYQWLFPNGFLEVPIGPGWTGRAWWPINMQEFETAQRLGQNLDLSQRTPQGIELARKKCFQMVEALKVPWSQIILAGFSQGAMLATDLYLRAPVAPHGLILFSGTLICQNEWEPFLSKRKGGRFFQSHGVSDPILGHKQAVQLNTFLNQNGMKGPLHSFQGGHEIPLAIIQKTTKYINEIDNELTNQS